jgi:hypothetical protein
VSFSSLHVTAQQAIKLAESDVSLEKEQKKRKRSKKGDDVLRRVVPTRRVEKAGNVFFFFT